MRKLVEMGETVLHDPYPDQRWKFKNQELYPGPSKKVFFRNQKKLADLQVLKDPGKALSGIDALVLAVSNKDYLDLDPRDIVRSAGKPIEVIDCFGILDDK